MLWVLGAQGPQWETAMTTVNVKLLEVGTTWTKPCRQAVAHLKDVFKRNTIKAIRN